MSNKLSKRLELDYSNILVAIFELMLRAGIREKDLLPVCIKSLERAELRARKDQKEECGGLVAASLVLDAWHRDRRYLDTAGRPKPVRLVGPTPSVEALVRRQKVRRNAAAVARRLKAVQLVVPSRKKGLYKPASDVAVISASNPLVLQHAAQALSTLLSTVRQNMSGTGNPSPLIERFAEVPDLAREHVKAFQMFTQAQGRTFLRTVNDWLESRRAHATTRRVANGTVRAGIHTYAYIASKQRSGPSP
jgi:hypothetical protein